MKLILGKSGLWLRANLFWLVLALVIVSVSVFVYRMDQKFERIRGETKRQAQAFYDAQRTVPSVPMRFGFVVEAGPLVSEDRHLQSHETQVCETLGKKRVCETLTPSEQYITKGIHHGVDYYLSVTNENNQSAYYISLTRAGPEDDPRSLQWSERRILPPGQALLLSFGGPEPIRVVHGSSAP